MDINSLQGSLALNSSTTPSFLDKQKSTETARVTEQTNSQNALDRVSTANNLPQGAEVQSKEKVDSLLTGLNSQLQTLQSFLKFEKDEDNQKMVFFIKNSETGETIRQIPSQDLLDISKNISKYLEMAQQTDVGGRTPPPVGLITNQIA
ncbi:flagellar protein FlaG [Thiosulfativibrio zosterae]|uniref:Flagellar protein FlaG n=1 Tax=Thiosulfativibrio zosterae TaxID=2675053 RepID=A0A6F8PM49_9GAMM|nr:flagellar protein FlaG [Thiosulfativibrio zosterae]BBP43124.1 hypothetical protein THMIRHAT_08700 [Thiosulfativibrio zosterae]